MQQLCERGCWWVRRFLTSPRCEVLRGTHRSGSFSVQTRLVDAWAPDRDSRTLFGTCRAPRTLDCAFPRTCVLELVSCGSVACT